MNIGSDIQIFDGDCLDLFAKVPAGSVDMILCDLPYGTTKNKWDAIIPFEPLWEQYKRIINYKGAIVLFSQSPFDKILVCSNLDMFRYEWIWEKPQGTGHLNANFAPLKNHENILVFSKGSACYVKNTNNSMYYFPQMEKGEPYKIKSGKGSKNYGNQKSVETINTGTRYPKSVIKFNKDKEKLHPTQKPVDLCEYLIKTYTTENMLVLDNCMGSGTTGVACVNTSRRFIGMELDDTYFAIAQKRIESAVKEQQQELCYEQKGVVNA